MPRFRIAIRHHLVAEQLLKFNAHQRAQYMRCLLEEVLAKPDFSLAAHMSVYAQLPSEKLLEFSIFVNETPLVETINNKLGSRKSQTVMVNAVINNEMAKIARGGESSKCQGTVSVEERDDAGARKTMTSTTVPVDPLFHAPLQKVVITEWSEQKPEQADVVLHLREGVIPRSEDVTKHAELATTQTPGEFLLDALMPDGDFV